jgi:hypothetical protein
MYLELRTWKGSGLAGQPAIPTRGFHHQVKSAARIAACTGEVPSPDRVPVRAQLPVTPMRTTGNFHSQ